MIIPPTHPREDDRTRTIEALGLDEIRNIPSFQDVVELLGEIVESPIVLFTVCYLDQQLFHARVGLDIDHTPRNVAFCAHAIVSDECVAREQILEIRNARSDERFADNPLVTSPPRIQSYAGRVVRAPNDLPLGTLCLIDRLPRRVTQLERLHLDRAGRVLEALIAAQAPK